MFKVLLLLLGLVVGPASMPCRAELRDPTQPAYPPPSAAANDNVNDAALVLSAILISPRSRRATINGVSGRQGQTIVIGQAPALEPASAIPANSTATGGKSHDQLNKTREYAKENHEPPLGQIEAPPHAPDSMDSLRPGEQSAGTAEASAFKQPTTAQHAGTAPMRSNTIKIISIRKNSVIVSQNGVLKTLQLVQRPYKTISSKDTQK